jgi:hypothetical protein
MVIRSPHLMAVSGDGHRMEGGAAMRCGKCGRDKVTVAQVKACYEGARDAHPMPAKFIESGLKEVTEEPMSPPSAKQVNYLLSLQAERMMPDGMKALSEAEAWLLEKPDVSARISALKFMQKKEKAKIDNWPEVPAGRYALYDAGPDDVPGAYSYVDRQDLVKPSYGQWRFYQVDKPNEGRWNGYTFVKILIGAPGAYRKENLDADRRVSIMRRIEEDPQKAMIDYGQQSGVCGRCSSPLTDPESLARGIGPICAGKMGL